MNLTTYFSLSFASFSNLCSSILDLAQYDILLKCSVNLVRFGLRSSFCSWAQISTSGISIFMNRSESSSVICSAICSLLKSSREACFVVTLSDERIGCADCNCFAWCFSRILTRRAFAIVRSPLHTNCCTNSIKVCRRVSSRSDMLKETDTLRDYREPVSIQLI